MLDRVEMMVERCGPAVAGGVRVFVVLVCLAAMIAVPSLLLGGCADGQHAWIKPLTCTGARVATRLFCGDESNNGGLLDGLTSGGESHPDDPESGGLGEE